MDSRQKHGWPFWFAVGVIALPFLYVASFFLLAWLLDSSRTKWHEVAFWRVYAPFAWLIKIIWEW